MFSPEQKRFIFENSVKINDQSKYIQVMGYYDNYFKKAKTNSIKRKIEFIAILLIILYVVGVMWLVNFSSVNEAVFKMSAVFVGALLAYKLGSALLNYIDELPIIEKIQREECDLLCYTGDLVDLSKAVNCGTSAAICNYFMTVSGNKFQIDRRNYKILEPHKGKKIKIFYFAELLGRQMYITDGSVILIEE
jgi:hypothetical protein